MKTIAASLCGLAAVAALAFTLPSPTHAQAPATQATDTTALTDGEVRKIDREGRKLTLKHGDIKHLDMPAMTMVFRVQDAAMLDGLAVGDRVRFRVIKADGGFVVTQLQRGQ